MPCGLILLIFCFGVLHVNADCDTLNCYDHGTCEDDNSTAGYSCTCDDNYSGDDCEYYMNTNAESAELIFTIMGAIFFAPTVVLGCTIYKKMAGVEIIEGEDEQPEVRSTWGTIHRDVYLKARSLIDLRDTYEPGGFKQAYSAIW